MVARNGRHRVGLLLEKNSLSNNLYNFSRKFNLSQSMLVSAQKLNSKHIAVGRSYRSDDRTPYTSLVSLYS